MKHGCARKLRVQQEGPCKPVNMCMVETLWRHFLVCCALSWGIVSDPCSVDTCSCLKEIGQECQESAHFLIAHQWRWAKRHLNFVCALYCLYETGQHLWLCLLSGINRNGWLGEKQRKQETCKVIFFWQSMVLQFPESKVISRLKKLSLTNLSNLFFQIYLYIWPLNHLTEKVAQVCALWKKKKKFSSAVNMVFAHFVRCPFFLLL